MPERKQEQTTKPVNNFGGAVIGGTVFMGPGSEITPRLRREMREHVRNVQSHKS